MISPDNFFAVSGAFGYDCLRNDTMERRQITDQSINDENQRRKEERFDTIFKAMLQALE